MATASAIEIKRAADQQRAADELAEIRAQLARIEAALATLLEQRQPQRGRAA